MKRFELLLLPIWLVIVLIPWLFVIMVCVSWAAILCKIFGFNQPIFLGVEGETK